MAAIIGDLAGVAEKYTGQALAFGLGFALANVLEPAAVALRQESWSKDGAQIHAVAATLLASGVAQGQVDRGDALEWAKQQGYDEHAFDAMVNIANTGPALGAAMEAWRRENLSDEQFDTALERAAIEKEWWPALRALKAARLDPAEIAKAIHRGIIGGDGLLLVEPPSEPGHVPIVPPSDLDAVKEAAAAGINAERLRVMVGNAGLPPGAVQMMELYNRGKITKDDFLRGVGQSNLRNEWGDALFDLHRRVLTPHDYVEAHVRAWITTEEMHAGAALSGVTAEDTDLLFKILGRPLSWHQVWIGLARGGKYGDQPDAIHPAFLKSLQESNIRPEWYGLAWAQRYSYPSAFVIRGMAQAGELTEDEVREILLYEGWEPALARKVAARWAGTGAAGGKQATVSQLETEYEAGHLTEQEFRAALAALDYAKPAQDHIVALGDARRSKHYREQAITAIAKAYTAFAINDAQAITELESVHVSATAAGELLSLWQKQRLYTITELTALQVKKAYGSNVIPRDSALVALERLHYTPESAAELLDE